MRAGRSFLTVLAVLVVLVAVDVSAGIGPGMRQATASMLPLLPLPPAEGGTLGSARDMQVSVDGTPAALQLEVPNGSVRVEGGFDGEVEIQVAVSVRALSVGEAERFAALVEPRVQGDAESTRVWLYAPLAPVGVTELVGDWTIRVPDGVDLSLNVSRGEVYVENIGGTVSIVADHCPQVILRGVRGDAAVILTRSPGTVQQVYGDLRITSRLSDTRVEDIGGTVTASILDYGTTHMVRAEEVIVRGSLGNLVLEEIRTAEVQTMGSVTMVITDEEAGLEYDIRAREITSDVPLNVWSEDRHRRAEGSFGRGEARLTATSIMGDVRIVTAPPAP